jgi:hypothetical protein
VPGTSTPRDESWYRCACSYTSDLRLQNLNVGVLPMERFTLHAAYAPSLHLRSASLRLRAGVAAGGHREMVQLCHHSQAHGADCSMALALQNELGAGATSP